MHFIGVHGTGTKTGIVLADSNKNIINSLACGPSSYVQLNVEQVSSSLLNSINKLLSQASVLPSDCTVAFCISGAEDQQLLDSRFERVVAGSFSRFILANDSVGAFLSAFDDEDGIVLLCGTGSIAYGSCNGNSAKSGGYGAFASDEGSGFWLGMEAVSLFYRQCDGRLPMGPLYKLMCETLQVSDAYSMMNIAYRRFSTDKFSVAQLQPILYQAAIQGDVSALNTYRRAATGLCEMAQGVRKQLGIDKETKFKVSYLGGVFLVGDIILSPLEELLAENNFILVKPKETDCVIGALKLAYTI